MKYRTQKLGDYLWEDIDDYTGEGRISYERLTNTLIFQLGLRLDVTVYDHYKGLLEKVPVEKRPDLIRFIVNGRFGVDQSYLSQIKPDRLELQLQKKMEEGEELKEMLKQFSKEMDVDLIPEQIDRLLDDTVKRCIEDMKVDIEIIKKRYIGNSNE